MDHKISKSDQHFKLRECLTGKALRCIPRTCKNIDVAWEILRVAFGDPRILLNHRLRTIRNMNDLTDFLMESDPGYAAIWYLDYGAAVEEIIELGKRSSTLAMTCFDMNTICIIIDKLPFRYVQLIYEGCHDEGKSHGK